MKGILHNKLSVISQQETIDIALLNEKQTEKFLATDVSKYISTKKNLKKVV